MTIGTVVTHLKSSGRTGEVIRTDSSWNLVSWIDVGFSEWYRDSDLVILQPPQTHGRRKNRQDPAAFQNGSIFVDRTEQRLLDGERSGGQG